MGDLWTAQVTRRQEADDTEVMEDLQRQWNDVRKYTPRMPTWAAISKTHVFRIRNLLLKWRRKATVTDARQPKITQWLSTTARDPGSARGAANRLATQQAQAEARAPRSRRRTLPTSRTVALQSTMKRWVRGAPNGANGADQTPPEDDHRPENDALGPATGTALEGTAAGTGHAAEANGASVVDIDRGWLPEPGRTQALSGRAAAHDDAGRCAYHLPPLGCTLIDGDADGPGLIEQYGLKPASLTSAPPETRPGAQAWLLDARPSDTPTGAGPSTEVRKRSANLVTWCERCAIGIHIRCADDQAIGHAGDDHIGNYCAKKIAAKSFLCHGCWTTHKPYVDESDEDTRTRSNATPIPSDISTASGGGGPVA